MRRSRNSEHQIIGIWKEEVEVGVRVSDLYRKAGLSKQDPLRFFWASRFARKSNLSDACSFVGNSPFSGRP